MGLQWRPTTFIERISMGHYSILALKREHYGLVEKS